MPVNKIFTLFCTSLYLQIPNRSGPPFFRFRRELPVQGRFDVLDAELGGHRAPVVVLDDLVANVDRTPRAHPFVVRGLLEGLRR